MNRFRVAQKVKYSLKKDAPAQKFKIGDVVNLADGKRYRIIEAYFSRERGKYDYFVAPYGEPFYVTEEYISHV